MRAAFFDNLVLEDSLGDEETYDIVYRTALYGSDTRENVNYSVSI